MDFDPIKDLESLADILPDLERLKNAVSSDETMSTSIMPGFNFLEANNNVDISGYTHKEGKIYDVMFKYLRDSEATKRPSTDYMERQTDINPSTRAALIDWLVQVAEKFGILSQTLFLTTDYFDRYLSGNSIGMGQLKVLGIVCMKIATKYQAISASKQMLHKAKVRRYHEIFQMESVVLNYLKFETAVPTAYSFLRYFFNAAEMIDRVSLSRTNGDEMLVALANYIAELSLLDYTMLRYMPSLIAASAVFLARFILSPSRKPWESKFRDYTLYQPFELRNCVLELHRLYCNGGGPDFREIKHKYSHHKYFSVATMRCPASIPEDFFQDV